MIAVSVGSELRVDVKPFTMCSSVPVTKKAGVIRVKVIREVH